MILEIDCECGHLFEAPDDLAGGITNCPGCGKAVKVPGLRDPLWRVLQVLGALLWAAVTAFAYTQGGLVPAAATAVVLAFVLWLVSRAL